MSEAGLHVTLLDSPCDRCGKKTDELFPYKFSKVTYRRKEIKHPWLCRKCIESEKEKAWKEKRIYGVHIPFPVWEKEKCDEECSDWIAEEEIEERGGK